MRMRTYTFVNSYAVCILNILFLLFSHVLVTARSSTFFVRAYFEFNEPLAPHIFFSFSRAIAFFLSFLLRFFILFHFIFFFLSSLLSISNTMKFISISAESEAACVCVCARSC